MEPHDSDDPESLGLNQDKDDEQNNSLDEFSLSKSGADAKSFMDQDEAVKTKQIEYLENLVEIGDNSDQYFQSKMIETLESAISMNPGHVLATFRLKTDTHLNSNTPSLPMVIKVIRPSQRRKLIVHISQDYLNVDHLNDAQPALVEINEALLQNQIEMDYCIKYLGADKCDYHFQDFESMNDLFGPWDQTFKVLNSNQQIYLFAKSLTILGSIQFSRKVWGMG
jgi:hypothetical protein